MNKKSIKTAILIPSLAVLIAGMIVLIAVVGVLSSNTANNLTQKLMEARVNEYTNEFRVLSRDAYSLVMGAEKVVENYTNADFVKGMKDPREQVVTVLTDMLRSNDKVVSMWTCWEPNAFDGKDKAYAGKGIYDQTGRFTPYIYKTSTDIKVENLEGYDDPATGDYYLGALNDTGKPYITDPYNYDFGGTNILIYTISVPIVKNGKAVGVVGVDVEIQQVIDMLNEADILGEGYFFALSPGGLVASYPDKEAILKDYKQTWMKSHEKEIDAAIKSGGTFQFTGYSDLVKTDVRLLGSAVTIGDTGRYWIVSGVIPEKTVGASSARLLTVIIIMGLALVVGLGLIIFFIIRRQLKDLPVLTGTAQAMAIGDIHGVDTNMDLSSPSKNEITLLQRAFTKMAAGVQQQANVLEQIAKGDYSVEIPVRSEVDVMNQALNDMLKGSNKMLFEIQQAADQVSSGAKQVAGGATNLATGNTQQAATIQEFSASISEIKDQSERVAQMSDNSRKKTADAGGLMENSLDKLQGLTQAMQAIDRSSEEISNIIKVIDDIAFQTNILALNAAVEAARAGVQGKGFAVVADEVRNLAAKSAEAAKETETLIQASVQNVTKGNDMMDKTVQSMSEVSEIAQEIARDMEEMSELSQQQSTAISQINLGVEQISSVVQANSATAQQSAAASEQMSAQSSMLNEIASRFKLKEQ